MWPFRKREHFVTIATDLVWLNEPAKWAGVLSSVEDALGRAAPVLLVAQYDWTLDALLELVSTSLEVRRLDNAKQILQSVEHSVRRTSTELLIVRAQDLPASHRSNPREETEAPRLEIIVADRNHNRSGDDRINRFADGLPFQCVVQFHSSMDDPIIELFAGEGTRNALLKLGMTDDEPIHSPMLTRVISRSQTKVEKMFGEVDEYGDRERLLSRLRRDQ